MDSTRGADGENEYGLANSMAKSVRRAEAAEGARNGGAVKRGSGEQSLAMQSEGERGNEL